MDSLQSDGQTEQQAHGLDFCWSRYIVPMAVPVCGLLQIAAMMQQPMVQSVWCSSSQSSTLGTTGQHSGSINNTFFIAIDKRRQRHTQTSVNGSHYYAIQCFLLTSSSSPGTYHKTTPQPSSSHRATRAGKGHNNHPCTPTMSQVPSQPFQEPNHKPLGSITNTFDCIVWLYS